MTRVATPIFDHDYLKKKKKKKKNHPLIFINLHQQGQIISSIFSRDKVDLKILLSDWLRAFWTVTQKHDISKIWDLQRNTTSNINFHYRRNSEKYQ